MKKLKKLLMILIILITVISFDIRPVKAESRISNKFTNNVYMLKKSSKKESSDNGVYNPDFTIKNYINSKGSTTYKVECKNFYYAQVFYRAMFFIGPFIYIIFASFDFFKIVMAGNEEEIKKAKKNIPIRLVLFLLFLILPLLVRIIAGRIGNTDPSVFKCIVGKTIEKPKEN